MNQELADLFAVDQADRQHEMPLDEVTLRDRKRRQRAVELLAAGEVSTVDDYFHAAVIFQHGDEPADFEQAAALAQKAADLGHPRGRRLYANAYDRWLTSRNLPQRYGTQYIIDSEGCRLMEVDPATTDEERARWDVPPLAECLAFAERFNAQRRG